MLTSTLFALGALASVGSAGYAVQDEYDSASFFTMFDFFTDTDPTDGFVDYVAQSAAESGGLISTNGSAIRIGVDSTNVASSAGRQSVRLTSSATYNHGLIILDLAHMPGGICGTWPAFWMVGPNWPDGGEIDIIEGVNSQTSNDMTLHTDDGCSISNTGNFSGSIATSNCYVDAVGQSANAGCQITSGDSATYGTGFNSNGGGVYATEWTSDAISIWFFPRGSIPPDITSGSPDPSGWSAPQASFSGSCDIDEHFQNQQIVFDTTFCGDWAGAVWSTDSTCSSQASTCQSFVQNNPSAFVDAYWEINSLVVYSGNSNSPVSSNISTTTGSNATTALPSASIASAVGGELTGSATTSGDAVVSTAKALASSNFVATTTTIETASAVVTTTAQAAAAAPVTTTQDAASPAETLTALGEGEFEPAGASQTEGVQAAGAIKRRHPHGHAKKHVKRNLMIGDEKRAALW